MRAKIFRIALLILLAGLVTWVRADIVTADAISILVNDVPLILGEGTAELRENRVFVPLRSLAEVMKLPVNFDPLTLRIEVGEVFWHVVGTSLVTMADERILDIGVSSYIKDSRTMVSLRMFSEALGAAIAWDGTQQVASIHTARLKDRITPTFSTDDVAVFRDFLLEHALEIVGSSGQIDFLIAPTDLDDDGCNEVLYLSNANAVHVFRRKIDGSVYEIGEPLEVGRSPIKTAQVVEMQGSEAKYVLLKLSDDSYQNWFILTRLMNEQLSYMDTSRAMADEMDDYLIDRDDDGFFDGYISEHTGEDVLNLPTRFLFAWDAVSETFDLVKMNVELEEPSQTPEGTVREYLVLRYLVQAYLDSADKSPEIEERLESLFQGDDSAFDATVLVDMEQALLYPEDEDAEIRIDLTRQGGATSVPTLVMVTFQHGEVRSTQSFSLRQIEDLWVIENINTR